MLSPDREAIEVTIQIEEGPQYKISQLDIYEIDDDGKRNDDVLGGRRHLRSLVKQLPGDVFSSTNLTKDLDAVKALYKNAGYAFVETNIEPSFDDPAKEVAIKVPIKRKALAHIGRIEVHGNTKTSDRIIRRELILTEGELYSQGKVDESRRRVMALGYFEHVDVTPAKTSTGNIIDLDFDIAEKPTGTFQVGAGFFIGGELHLHRANPAGKLHGSRADDRSPSAGFEPSPDDQPALLRALSVRLVVVRVGRFVRFRRCSIRPSRRRRSAGPRCLAYPIINPYLRWNVTYTGEQVHVSTTPGSTILGTSAAITYYQRLPLANLFNDGFLSSIRGTIMFDPRQPLVPDRRRVPAVFNRMGRRRDRRAEPVHEAQGDGASLSQLRSDVVLKLNLDWGYISSPKDSGVPIFLRFMLGGIYDLRGYNLRTVGPRLPLNQSLDPQ